MRGEVPVGRSAWSNFRFSEHPTYAAALAPRMCQFKWPHFPAMGTISAIELEVLALGENPRRKNESLERPMLNP